VAWRAVNKLAKEKADLKAKRAAEDKAITATPKTAKLKLVKGPQAERHFPAKALPQHSRCELFSTA